jgi:hypothetical protein
LLVESVARWRELQARSELALILYHLGQVSQLRGDDTPAAAYYDESLGLYVELGDKHHIALLRCRKAYMSHGQGNHMQAAALFKDSLRLCCDCAFEDGIASCLVGLNRVSLARGQPARAARLLGAAMQARPRQTSRLLSGGEYLVPLHIASGHTALFHQLEFERNIAAARAKLDEAAFAAAWAAGRALSLDQAIAEALGLIDQELEWPC